MKRVRNCSKKNALYYKKKVECFRNKLSWDLVAKQHIKLYTDALAQRQKKWIIDQWQHPRFDTIL